MSQVLPDLLYTKEHEWVKVLSDNLVRIGITDFAQAQLGDIVFVELPQEGANVTADESIGSVESVKTVSDIFCPVNGVVKSVNKTLETSPEVANTNPYEDGWLAEVEVSVPEALKELLTAEQYQAFTDGE
ncbi:glycine cleavage system protein GcvH [Paenibacillus larvae]|uniref:Glycine cleavage system H protein n=4 Tax=Paenibacillus larvae TaxID=1464 RepID=V9WE26_9BACL|nr:glycine cleavage system protein GcvH [Paenibacillus larvae]AHD07357.1 glycine cleavage system H protein GcvH [Paenibacillus larvae subsp. larvae DSM 25430]AQR79173.1 glycine cleavage system protein H [Paenibacillus larvae subsp. larvae]AQT85526.1 glycine cleavage system protein H [Paenibacillus larvae subsp. pulvifaciens]AQZ47533.1 glycine cleavage system protein H [Paenibacillus larvae subsp. pulvifaciens]ARF68835.1 glycine cleavage system protein H [Paenibacillus larvae subsp. pulvifacien